MSCACTTRERLPVLLKSGDGYMVGINNQLVQVNDSHGHKVFRRVQP